MEMKYIKCFDNRLPNGNGSAFEQVAWCKTLKQADGEFEKDIPWAKDQHVDQYIFKLVKVQRVTMDMESKEIKVKSRVKTL